MSEINLLKLAAKAGGINLNDEMYAGWNPFVDDGDALRLAVQLGLFFKHFKERYELFHRLYLEELTKDNTPSVAARYAIVRAAAEIAQNSFFRPFG